MADIIKEICVTDANVGEIACALYNALMKLSPQCKKNCLMSYPDLVNLYIKENGGNLSFTDEINNDKIYIAIQVLCNPKVSLLRLEYFFVDENDDFYPVNVGEVMDAEKNHIFEHPVTGDILTDYEDFIFPFFSLKKVGS